MRLISFSDYDGHTIAVPADQVESVREPSGRVHDHGGLILKSGRSHSFNSDSTARRIIEELREA